jgi:hypothetical protein
MAANEALTDEEGVWGAREIRNRQPKARNTRLDTRQRSKEKSILRKQPLKA